MRDNHLKKLTKIYYLMLFSFINRSVKGRFQFKCHYFLYNDGLDNQNFILDFVYQIRLGSSIQLQLREMNYLLICLTQNFYVTVINVHTH